MVVQCFLADGMSTYSPHTPHVSLGGRTLHGNRAESFASLRDAAYSGYVARPRLSNTYKSSKSMRGPTNLGIGVRKLTTALFCFSNVLCEYDNFPHRKRGLLLAAKQCFSSKGDIHVEGHSDSLDIFFVSCGLGLYFTCTATFSRPMVVACMRDGLQGNEMSCGNDQISVFVHILG